jgi:hypothetical protein
MWRIVTRGDLWGNNAFRLSRECHGVRKCMRIKELWMPNHCITLPHERMNRSQNVTCITFFFSCVAGEIVERCLTETFSPECPSDQVLLMSWAAFGRMATGRCMPQDYGHSGCQVDVLPFIDARCSGRRRCSVEVIDVMKLGLKPCQEGFSSFLKVSYSCHKGKQAI